MNQKPEVLFVFKNVWDARKAIGNEKRISKIVSKQRQPAGSIPVKQMSAFS